MPGELLEVLGPLLEEGVAALAGLVGAVGEAGGLAGEELLTDEAKIAILLASLCAAVVGVLVLMASTRSAAREPEGADGI